MKVKVGIFMRELLINFIPKVLMSIVFIFSLISCSAIDQAIHPDEKPLTWPTFEQILIEDYKGPKARVVVINFTDKSARDKETSQVGDGWLRCYEMHCWPRIDISSKSENL